MTKNNRLTNGYDSINVLNGLVFFVFIGATNVVLFNVVQGFLLSFQSKVVLELGIFILFNLKLNFPKYQGQY